MIRAFVGENDAARAAEVQRLVAEFVSEHGDMAVERLDGEEASYERMAEAAQSVPFLSERKLLVLRRPGANKEFAEKLEDFIHTVSDSVDVLLVEGKLDKRLSYYKQLKKLPGFREFAVLDAQGLANVARAYVSEQGGELSAADARTLVERTGADQLGLQQELDKLLVYDKTITRDSIELLTERTPQSSVFELLDAAFSGDVARTMRLYDEQRALKVEPQQMVAMLAWQLHVLALVKTAGSRSTDMIAKEAKLNPFVVQKTQAIARHLTLVQLKKLITSLRELDVRTKSQSVVVDDVVRYYLLELTQTHQAVRS